MPRSNTHPNLEPVYHKNILMEKTDQLISRGSAVILCHSRRIVTVCAKLLIL